MRPQWGLWSARYGCADGYWQKNKYIKVYSILVLAEHKIELFELDRETRHQFINDISDVSRILNDTLSPIKINVEMQGNVVPHLHCHVKPRFETDTPGHARIFQGAGTAILPAAEFSAMRDELRERMSGNSKARC
ncbi:MAG: HIT family protein [Pseudochelatococcus sp.]|jgi:diadenosine tetraphosphate (Ap4A) HIT family hydrolase|uniref:HIT family protein n=1 Tax=Pseudochelatococcus sp. TaxID=2020869 RepID=UPI003D8E347C